LPGGATAQGAGVFNDAVGPPAPGLAKGLFGVGAPSDEPRQLRNLLAGDPLAHPHGVAVPADLLLDGVAEPEALGSQLLHELGVPVVLGGVDGPHGLQQREGESRLDRPRSGCWRWGLVADGGWGRHGSGS
jgi:hypothetical protein